MAAIQFLGTKYKSFKNDGTINANGTVEFFTTGGTFSTYVSSYSDSALTSPNSNTITLDSAGEADIWLGTVADVRVKDSSGAIVDTFLNWNPEAASSVPVLNLVSNGSFEEYTGGIPTSWDEVLYTGGTSDSDSSANNHGKYSYKFTSVGNGGGYLTTTGFQYCGPTNDLIIQFDIKSSVADVRNIVDILWYDGAEAAISTTSVYDNSTTNPTSWTRYGYQVTPPSTARKFKVRLYGCHSADATIGNTSFDNVYVTETLFKNVALTFNKSLTLSSAPIWTAEGASIASAADCNIWANKDGNTVHITGTTTISDWGTAPQAGAWMRVIFDGALTLTYNATTNDIEGGVDVTVAAGDSVEVYAVSTSAYQVRNISRNSVDEVSVASAATTNIGATASENVNITGTTTITGLGTIGAGVVKNVRFAGALTLTHNATSLILPGSANITTAANDTAIFQSLGSGNWICTNYKKASGAPITVTESSLGAASVSQTKLKTTTGEVSVAAASQNLTLPGGEYGFYPQIRVNTGSMTATIGSSVTNTSYVTNIHLNATNNGYAQHIYIQASPPYDLGDGEIQLFVFALLDSSGNIVATYVAPEAPWHYNGPTDIRAERYTYDRRGYRTMNEFIAEHGSIKNAVIAGMPMEQAILEYKNARLIDTEITQSIKNADMDLIPHPFVSNNLTGKTVIMLDPVGDLCNKLCAFHDSGESVSEILREYIRINNTGLQRNKPKGVMVCSGLWK